MKCCSVFDLLKAGGEMRTRPDSSDRDFINNGRVGFDCTFNGCVGVLGGLRGMGVVLPPLPAW